jgi:hypothetical protein
MNKSHFQIGVNALIAGGLFVATNVLATDANQAAVARGQALHADKCATCHAEKSGLGDGNVLYLRSDKKANNLKQLEGMVARCNSELRLDLFPEDEADVVAFLQKNFYKFK